MSTDNVTPERARNAVALIGWATTLDGEPPRDIALRYVDQSAARIAELQSLTAWRPIDTAPRDGTRVLLYVPDWHFASKYQEGFWSGSYWESFDGTSCAPTHWLPLPAAPEVSNGK